jgi:hypothetical protein
MSGISGPVESSADVPLAVSIDARAIVGDVNSIAMIEIATRIVCRDVIAFMDRLPNDLNQLNLFDRTKSRSFGFLCGTSLIRRRPEHSILDKTWRTSNLFSIRSDRQNLRISASNRPFLYLEWRVSHQLTQAVFH